MLPPTPTAQPPRRPALLARTSAKLRLSWSMPLQEVCTTGTVLGNGEVHVASRFNDHIESSPTPLSRANVLTAARHQG